MFFDFVAVRNERVLEVIPVIKDVAHLLDVILDFLFPTLSLLLGVQFSDANRDILFFIVADDRLNAILQTDFITQLPNLLVFLN